MGIVKSITLKNFMCHANLGPFAFGSNVNFVVGKNGSELLFIHSVVAISILLTWLYFTLIGLSSPDYKMPVQFKITTFCFAKIRYGNRLHL